jgi:hypothetical protein
MRNMHNFRKKISGAWIKAPDIIIYSFFRTFHDLKNSPCMTFYTEAFILAHNNLYVVLCNVLLVRDDSCILILPAIYYEFLNTLLDLS